MSGNVQITQVPIDYSRFTVTREQLVQGELESAIRRDSPLAPAFELLTPWPWVKFCPNEFSRTAIERGWIHEDGTTTGLGRCIHELHRNLPTVKADTSRLFEMLETELAALKFDVMSAGWGWTSALADMCIEFYSPAKGKV